MTENNLTSEQARERLAAAEQFASATTRRAAPVAAITTAGVGVLVALVLAVSYATLPEHPVAFAVSLAAYGVALTALMVWYHRRQVVAQRGFGTAYGWAFTLTMTLYTIGIASLRVDWPWLVAVVYCFVVALPMTVAAIRMARGCP
ncbi:hypothetical protein [Micromonospora gifhornensis]|uniref:hypothetical protein n=1 Tax=Micromonospora gifhornensis TaxID=84594 RepID=UPI00364F1CD1